MGTGKSITLASCAHRISPYPELDVGNYFGFETGNEPVTTVAAKEAYEKAGIGPEDVSFAELQDTDASGEIMFSEELLLCKAGEGGKLVSDGVTELVGIATLTEYRRRGYGGALTTFAAQSAFANGASLVFLTAADEAAGRVYQRVGFQPLGELLLMTKKLMQ